MADSVGGDMIRGHIDSIILNSLLDGDKDTNQIRTEIENKAGGNFKLKQGTFYSALQRISKQGFVTEYRTSGNDGVRRKFFQLTEKGKEHIEKSQNTWSQSQNVINRLLDAEPDVKPVKQSSYSSDELKIPSFDEPQIMDFDALADREDEEPGIAERLIYGDESIFNEESPKASVSDSDVSSIIGALSEETTTATVPAEEPVKEPETEEIAPTISTYTYFENTHEPVKNEPFKGSVLIDDGINPKIPEDAETSDETEQKHESFDSDSRFTDDYEPLYNSDVSTDSFIASEPKNERKTESSDNVTTETVKTSSSDAVSDSITEKESANDTFETKSPSEPVAAAEKNEATDYSDRVVSSESTLGSDSHYKQLSIGDEFNFDKKDDRVTAPAPEEDPNEPDDFLRVDDIPDQREYKDILSKIFSITEKKEPAVSNESSDSKIIEFPTNPDFVASFEKDESSKRETSDYKSSSDRAEDRAKSERVKDDDASFDDVVVDKLDISDKIIPEKPVNEKRGDSALKPKGGFDYSDILAMSEEEGFKISTSDRTNKTELGKIFVNKLNFHSSLIFFLIMSVETLIVGLTMDHVLKFGLTAYLLFELALFILPLLFGINFFVSPRRAVSEIRSFKSAFETALIVTLNLLIAILVLTVVFDLDYSSYPDVARSLLVPLLIVVNVPVYVIIKYSLLERQSYYS